MCVCWGGGCHIITCHYVRFLKRQFSRRPQSQMVPSEVPGGLHYDKSLYFFLINLFYLFIYFWLRWAFVAARGLPLVAASGGYSSLWCMGFSLRWLPLLWSTGSRRAGFSRYGTRAQQLWLVGSRAQAQQLWRMGLVAPRHVGSSWTRARTRVPCIGRRILNHCTTRKVPSLSNNVVSQPET